jgi:hypothetical protein
MPPCVFRVSKKPCRRDGGADDRAVAVVVDLDVEVGQSLGLLDLDLD